MTHHEHLPLEGKRGAVMIGPLFEDVEATYPYYRLLEAGATVELIGIEGDATVKGKKGQELRTENAAADLIADDLDLLVIAGGYGPTSSEPMPGSGSSFASSTRPESRLPSSATPAGFRSRPASSTAGV